MNWTDSPCAACSFTPCCSHLPLHSFKVNTREEWERAGKLLEFPGIRLGLRSDGEFRIYLNRSCPNFMADKRCAVHDTPVQSRICMKYSPHTCWYKRAFSEKSTLLLILIDRERWLLFDRQLGWNKDKLDHVPGWEDLCKMADKYPLNINPEPFSYFLSERSVEWDFLLMPPGKPLKKEHWDLVRFKLSFPGIYLSCARHESSPWAFLITRPGFNPKNALNSSHKGWDPFFTNHDVLKADLMDINDLNRMEKIKI